MHNIHVYRWILIGGSGLPTWIRVGGSALVEESGGTVCQGTVHNIGVASDPADVSHTAEDITVSVVEHVLC